MLLMKVFQKWFEQYLCSFLSNTSRMPGLANGKHISFAGISRVFKGLTKQQSKWRMHSAGRRVALRSSVSVGQLDKTQSGYLKNRGSREYCFLVGSICALSTRLTLYKIPMRFNGAYA